MTRLYNGELKNDGIEITQFTLLMALNQTSEIPQGELGKLLALDSTSLTRMLDLLKKRGWVQAKEGEDRRMRLFSLTAAGRSKFRQALPHWQRAQDRVLATIGEKAMAQLSGSLMDVTRATL